MKGKWTWLVGIVLAVSLTSAVWAADNDNHTVTVTVDAINEIAISGGDIELTISTATAGSQPDSAADVTCGLDWTVNTTSKKITVQAAQASFAHTLKVVATGVTGGTAAAEVTLDGDAHDFVTGVATTLGGCGITYSAWATAAQGVQSVVHTVTYTITAAS